MTTYNAYLQAAATQAYLTSGYARTDAKYGKSKFAKLATESNPEGIEFQKWLGSCQADRKASVISDFVEVKGSITVTQKRTILRLMNRNFNRLRFMKELVELQFNG